MGSKTEWSKEQQERTRDVLERVDIIAFSFSWTGEKKGCPLNHLSGRNGYITIDDALRWQWKVYDEETDELIESYNTIDDVVNDGWKVST